MGPDFSALDGTGIEQVIGALLTIVLIAAIIWTVGTGVAAGPESRS